MQESPALRTSPPYRGFRFTGESGVPLGSVSRPKARRFPTLLSVPRDLCGQGAPGHGAYRLRPVTSQPARRLPNFRRAALEKRPIRERRHQSEGRSAADV
jgi:hypothetical protein